MKTRQEMVTEFFEKYGFPQNVALADCKNEPTSKLLRIYSRWLTWMAKRSKAIFEAYDDPRALRIHGMLEELGELAAAMATGDDLKAIDALADLEYFSSGTSVTFGYDGEGAFAEVHKSNMTKTKTDKRLRAKGNSYIPPNLQQYIKK